MDTEIPPICDSDVYPCNATPGYEGVMNSKITYNDASGFVGHVIGLLVRESNVPPRQSRGLVGRKLAASNSVKTEEIEAGDLNELIAGSSAT